MAAILLAVFGRFVHGAARALALRDHGDHRPIAIECIGACGALWAGAAGTLLLPFLAAIWLNHEMWGYYVSRPDLDRRIVEARRVETMTRVETVLDSNGRLAFSGVPVGEVDSFIEVHPQEGDYYVLEGRVFGLERASSPAAHGPRNTRRAIAGALPGPGRDGSARGR